MTARYVKFRSLWKHPLRSHRRSWFTFKVSTARGDLAVIRDHDDVMYEVLLKSQLLHLILQRQALFTLQVNCKHALVLHKGFCFLC